MIPDLMKIDLKQLDEPQLFGSRSMLSRKCIDGFDPCVQIGPYINLVTDWDFSQQYSDYYHKYLVATGFICFTPENLAGYCDTQTRGVYIKHYVDPKDPLSSVTINVVLHKDERLFRRVWNAITPEFYYKHLWKRSPRYAALGVGECKLYIREIMNQLYRIVEIYEP